MVGSYEISISAHSLTSLEYKSLTCYVLQVYLIGKLYCLKSIILFIVIILLLMLLLTYCGLGKVLYLDNCDLIQILLAERLLYL